MTVGRKRRAAVLLCSVALAAFTGTAFAKPGHKPAHRHHAVQAAAPVNPAARDDRYPGVEALAAAPSEATQGRKKGQRAPAATGDAFGGFTSDSLVSEARKYIGSNPTGRGSLWCGAFMDLVLKRTGHAGGGNLASAYARYGTRVSGPQVGAIAVMGRNGGGHVGVVSGIDPNGNPIIVSGNTWSRESGGRHTVLEHVYPRSRISAYVLPGN